MKNILLAVILLSLSGCDAESPTSPQPIEAGVYVGSMFFAENTGTDSVTTTRLNMAFTFSDSGWYTWWYTYKLYYPDGGGKFQIKGDSIVLTDQVPHLGIYDWTLILGGSFYYRLRSDSLIMIQDDKQLRRYRYINLAHSTQQLASSPVQLDE